MRKFSEITSVLRNDGSGNFESYIIFFMSSAYGQRNLLAAYKTICRSVISYAASVQTLSLNDTQWRNFQSCQNADLRTVKGCLPT